MMTEIVIHLDGALPLAVLDERGWTQGNWTDAAGHVCAHQAIRLCAPVPGDAHLIERVAGVLWNRGPGWNDNPDTTEAEVREWLAAGVDVTDADLAEVFGPQWRAVVSLVRRSAVLTEDEAGRRGAAWGAAQAVVTWDLATVDGPYTHAHRDLLLAPWVEVCGVPEGLLDNVKET